MDDDPKNFEKDVIIIVAILFADIRSHLNNLFLIYNT
jgi:hypothetical protein